MKKTDKKLEKIAKEFLAELDKRGEGKKGTIDRVDLSLHKMEIGFCDDNFRDMVNVCTLDLRINQRIDDDYAYYSVRFLLPVNGAVTMQPAFNAVANNVIDELLETVQCDTLTEMINDFDNYYDMDYTKIYNIVTH